MRIRGGFTLLLVALFISACNLRRPQVTLTLAPIETSTLAPIDATAAPELAETATLTPSMTSSPIATVTEMPSATPASPTATETAAPSPTPILPPTSTPTSSATAAEDDTPTATSPPTADGLRPTLTFPPTMDDTEVAQLLATRPPLPTQPADGTAASPPPLTAATASTPVLTRSADSDQLIDSTPLGTPPPAEVGVRERLPPPSPTLFQPTVAVRPEWIPPTISVESLVPPFGVRGASVFQYNVDADQAFSFPDIPPLAGGVRLFLPNPIDANSWVRTDHFGIVRFRPIDAAQEGMITRSPYHEGYAVPSIDVNKNRVVELDWSADGMQFSFRIDPPQGTDTSNAGVWFWQPIVDPAHGAAYAVIRDCPADGHLSCQLVNRVGNPWQWQTRGVQWSPIRGSNTLLLTVRLTAKGRNALALVEATRDTNYARQQPRFVRYDYGYWNPNGQGIVVSGRRPDDIVIIGEVNNDWSGERVILNGSERGLWLRDAVRRPNGEIFALGRKGKPGSGPVALFDSAGVQLTPFIGDAAPEDLRWFPERDAALVSVRGRQYVVEVDSRRVTDVTDRLSDPQFEARAPAVASGLTGLIENSQYAPGEQLRLLQPLNIRQEPSTARPPIGSLQTGDYIAILAGPHRDSRYVWWQVQTASDVIGWIAGQIDGAPTIGQF
ncbi:MAG: SH3 domain-containing protein [Chloroflexi bacterium]|nr:SH3 domain-containing protein [Chloroflexota bacterium]